MPRVSWLAIIALTGAGLLFWRIGGAIGAEIGYHDARFDGSNVPFFIHGLFALGLLIPGTMAWSAVFACMRPDQRSARRVAIAAAVALYFVLPAMMHVARLRPSATPTFAWAIGAFLLYRFLLRPVAMKAASATSHTHA